MDRILAICRERFLRIGKNLAQQAKNPVHPVYPCLNRCHSVSEQGAEAD